MDQQALIEQIMRGLRREVEALVQSTDFTEETISQTEERGREFAKRCGAIGFGVLLDATVSAQDHGHVGQQIVTAEGTARFERYAQRWVLTHLGRFRIRRAYYWNSGAQCGTIPLDVRWDLDEREPSPALRTSLGMMAAEAPFARGATMMKQLALVELPEKRLQESGEDIGRKLKAQRDADTINVPVKRDDPAAELPAVLPQQRKGTLYVLMDGGRINTRSEGWKEPKVATLYWDNDRAEVSKDRRVILHKEYIATLGDADQLADFVWEAAVRWQFWRAERIVVLGDGAPWIWNRAADLFPNAIQILDRYHVDEHIWKVARLLFGGSGKHKNPTGHNDNVIELDPKNRKTRAWAKQLLDLLDIGDLNGVLTELKQQASPRSDTQAAIDELIGYIEDNRCRMHYHTYRDLGLSIGSGAIESGVKNVVNQRMKGCGMRWAPDRAEQMLHLRAAYLSDVGPAHELLAA